MFLYPAIVLVCLFGFASSQQGSGPFLLAFGPDNGDTINSKRRDGCSEEQFFDRSFRIGHNRYQSAYVCMNGYLAFGEKYERTDPYDFYFWRYGSITEDNNELCDVASTTNVPSQGIPNYTTTQGKSIGSTFEGTTEVQTTGEPTTPEAVESTTQKGYNYTAGQTIDESTSMPSTISTIFETTSANEPPGEQTTVPLTSEPQKTTEQTTSVAMTTGVTTIDSGSTQNQTIEQTTVQPMNEPQSTTGQMTTGQATTESKFDSGSTQNQVNTDTTLQSTSQSQTSGGPTTVYERTTESGVGIASTQVQTMSQPQRTTDQFTTGEVTTGSTTYGSAEHPTTDQMSNPPTMGGYMPYNYGSTPRPNIGQITFQPTTHPRLTVGQITTDKTTSESTTYAGRTIDQYGQWYGTMGVFMGGGTPTVSTVQHTTPDPTTPEKTTTEQNESTIEATTSYGNKRKKRSSDASYSTTLSLIAPYFSRIGTNDNLLDYECFETFANSAELGTTYTNNVEQICSTFQSLQQYPTLSTLTFFQSIRSDYVTDEELRSQIQQHSETPINFRELLEKGATFDDEITLDVMGQDTQYPNLANNVFKRQLRPEDMTVVTDLLFATHGFNATWGYVATWYKMGAFPGRVDAFNSFQVILTCDDGGTPDDECDDRCMTIFDFFQLQWITNSRSRWWFSHHTSGFNDGRGNMYQLPSSGTVEVRNLWAQSNIGMMGIWVFEMDQRSASPFVIPGGKLSSGLLNFNMLCSGGIWPRMSNMIRSQQALTIYNCVMPAFETLEVKFTGTVFEQVVPASYDVDSLQIKSFLPDYWCVDEQVQIQLVMDSVTLLGSETMYMYSPIWHAYYTISVSNHEDTLGYYDIDWSRFWWLRYYYYYYGSDFNLTELVFTGLNKTGLQLEEAHLITQVSSHSGASSFRYYPSPRLPGSTSVFFRLFVLSVNSWYQISSVPIFQSNNLITCESWAEEESKRDLSLCTEELGKWFGCPRVVNAGGAQPWWLRWDGLAAVFEVWLGVSGWEDDICCSFSYWTRLSLTEAGICNTSRCEFNPGAQFCVRSPRLACLDPNTEKVQYVSNQCCYDSNWDLIEEGDGAGTLQLQFSSIKNVAAHYWSDLLPYKECCGDSTTSQSCQEYKRYRPTVIGGYWPRNILIGRGDPDFTTVDGVNYPFMGLGVFVMLRNILDDPSTMHISTRRAGKGSVFSGFAAIHKTNRLQCYLADNGTLHLKVNDEQIDYSIGRPEEVVLNNITIKMNENRTGFNFTFDESGLKVNVVVMSNFLNLVVSVPPTFKNKMAGLLGYYDGESWNDFTNSTGHILPNDTDYYTLHEYFGDSWKVTSTSDWLFTDTEMSGLIALDIENGSPFNASYEIEFESDELRLQAQVLCKNDTACMRDVALTGDVSFAEVVDVMSNTIEIAETVNEISRVNEPDWAVQNATTGPPTSDIEDNIDEDNNNVNVWITVGAGIVFAVCVLVLFFILIKVFIKYH